MTFMGFGQGTHNLRLMFTPSFIWNIFSAKIVKYVPKFSRNIFNMFPFCRLDAFALCGIFAPSGSLAARAAKSGRLFKRTITRNLFNLKFGSMILWVPPSVKPNIFPKGCHSTWFNGSSNSSSVERLNKTEPNCPCDPTHSISNSHTAAPCHRSRLTLGRANWYFIFCFLSSARLHNEAPCGNWNETKSWRKHCARCQGHYTMPHGGSTVMYTSVLADGIFRRSRRVSLWSATH